MMPAAAVPGLYGKLPALGDFVSRRLPPAFVSTWDAWIQDALTASRQVLDADWLDIYLTSPIWRFVMTAGSCGDSPSAGILMPSVDKVGRYFPLTLAAIIGERIDLPYLFITQAGWFEALEELALDALEDDFQLDDLDRQLQQLTLDPLLSGAPHASSAAPKRQADNQAPIRIEMQTLSHMPQAFNELTKCLVEREYAHYSMWSTEGSDLLSPSLLIYRGLPPPTEFSGFLTGNWPPIGESHPLRISPFFFHLQDKKKEPAERESDRSAADQVRWHGVGLSHVGKVRKLNEDAFLARPEAGIWAVADGMGGHRAGDEASRAIVEELSGVESTGSIDALIADVTNALQATNMELVQRAQSFENGQIMGSTVVVLLAKGNDCATLWAGDSRLYRYRHGRLSQLTRDHSETGEREDISSETPTGENSSNVITRALGGDQDLLLDTIRFQAMHGDQYLLCSDGLVKAISAQEIETALSQTQPEQCARDLINLALEKNARDNVTVVVTRIDAP